MNREQLWNMIGLADDKYVDEEIPAAGTKGVKTGKHRFAALLTAAALVILLAASAVAAHHFSVPKQLQENMYIEKSDITDIVDLSDPGKGGIQIENKSQETAGYTVTFEAIVSGSRLYSAEGKTIFTRCSRCGVPMAERSIRISCRIWIWIS